MSTFTPRELEISNKSYTNKDFEAIYLELLETAEKISSRFSPTHANEADPFIILLKLVAAVSDKINYNVDKNVLERFLLSCTQEKSMRELTEMLGYTMKYYNSAETSVSFKFNFNSLDQESEITEVVIPAYSIVSTDDAIQYITLENATINKDEGISKEVAVIQGKLKELTVLGSNVIQLHNLNASNRLYLPEVMIAENGISVNNTSSSNTWQSWTSSTNLNSETYGTMVYKFGFDSVKNLPYLEFPTWISEIIGDGLSIKYLITDGSSGNVAARALTKVSRASSSDDIDDASIVVVNTSAASSGSEPESISEAYKSFKKIIGTFDTLVTCRDYANKIYNLINQYGNPYVSNIQVGDRRTDINYSCDVVTASDFGSQVRSQISYKYDVLCNSQELDTDIIPNLAAKDLNLIYYVYDLDKYYVCKQLYAQAYAADPFYTLLLLDESELIPVISPYDICLYGLKNISNKTYLGIDDANGYNMSYTLLNDDVQLTAIKNHLSSSKTMPHVYKTLQAKDIAYIRNDYKLDATINTAQKVNALEQSEILININNALIAKYNPRSLNFGNEISFDELLTTIEKADSRIKSVSLQEPEQNPKIIMANNQEVDLYDSDGNATDQFKFIVAKNILSGRIEVFKYDTEFEYGYTQQEARKYSNLMKAITECNIEPFPLNFDADNAEATEGLDAETSYILNNNETIQFLAPTFKTEVTYPYGINYYLKLSSENSYIAKDTEYKLSGDDLLIFSYTDNNDEIVIKVYKGTDNTTHIIKPNFDFYTSDYRRQENQTPTKEGISNSTYPTEYHSDAYPFYTLSSNQSVEYKTFISEKLNTAKKCYWLTNQVSNRIDWQADGDNYYSYILGDGEYFFYTDSNLSSLFAFGSGTKLRLYSENASFVFDIRTQRSIWTHNNYIDVDTITEQGLSSLGDYFILKAFNSTRFILDIFENEIITLTSGDTITVTNNSDSAFSINNNYFANIPAGVAVKYKFDGNEEEFQSLPDRSTLSIDDAGWKCRSVLDLNVGPTSPQTLVANQKIIFIPGVYDMVSKRWIAFTDIKDSCSGGNIELTAISNNTFESSIPLIRGGGADVNLEYMDLNLTYNCPSILIFNDMSNTSAITNLGEGYYSTNLSLGAAISEVEENQYRAFGDVTLYTAPIDAKIIGGVLSGELPLLSSPETNEAIQRYFNNKYYYHSTSDRYNDLGYYKVTYNDATSISTTDLSQHNMADLSTHTFTWQKATSIRPSSRLVMIYLNNLDGKSDNILGVDVISKTVTLRTEGGLNLIRKYNEVNDINTPASLTNSITLTQGLNVIEITDNIEATTEAVYEDYCDYLVMSASVLIKRQDSEDGQNISEEALQAGAKTALASISVLLSKLKINKGINPDLGLSASDDIILYLKTYFNRQFKNFFINAEFDQAKIINTNEDYPLSSAQAFYDSNNIANNWVMPRIDFPSSSIRIARSSKK